VVGLEVVGILLDAIDVSHGLHLGLLDLLLVQRDHLLEVCAL
jgi:hypothetical protein